MNFISHESVFSQLEGLLFEVFSGALAPNMVGPPTILDIAAILHFCSFIGFLILLESCLFIQAHFSLQITSGNWVIRLNQKIFFLSVNHQASALYIL